MRPGGGVAHGDALVGGLHGIAEVVGYRLVESARLVQVDEPGGVLGDAVGHLVADHVQAHGQRHAVHVAVDHLGAVPEGVGVVLAVARDVDDGVDRAALAVDAVAADLVLVELVDLGGVQVCVDRAGGGVGAVEPVARGGRRRNVLGDGATRHGQVALALGVVRAYLAAGPREHVPGGVDERVRPVRLLVDVQLRLGAVHAHARPLGRRGPRRRCCCTRGRCRRCSRRRTPPGAPGCRWLRRR